MKKSLFLMLVSAAVANSLHALPLRFLAWDESVVTRKVGVVSGKGVDPVPALNVIQRSKPVDVSPGEEGIVLRATDRTSPDGKPLDFKVERAAGFSRPLIILLPDPKSPAGIKAVAVEDSSENFPWGTFRFMNTTGKPLGLIAAKERKLLPPDWSPVDVKPQGTESVKIALFTSDAPSTPMYNSFWSPDSETRRLVILATGTDTRLGPVALKVILEDRSQATTPGASAGAGR